MAGLDPVLGFVIPTLPEIVDDINATELALISSSLDVQPTAIIGVMNGIVAAKAQALWELGGALYNGMNPDAATGDQLGSLALLTGDERQPATATVVEGCIVNVAAGFSAAPGQMVAQIVGNAAVQFESLDAVNNPTAFPANVTVDFVATTTGPVQALAGTLTVIAQALAGWNSITNPADGIVGKPIEVDSALRTRRQNELTAPGSDTPAAIKADVLASNGAILQCNVLFNDGSATDANGLPPHFIEVIAYQPGATTDDDIALAQTIFDSKAAGDGTTGSSQEVAEDQQGNAVVISFTRPTEVPIYVDVTVVTDPDVFAGGGMGGIQVQAALANLASTAYDVGADVIAKRLQAALFTVPGVIDFTAFTLGTAPSPTGTGNVAITIRQIATLSTANVAVTVT